MFQIAQCDSDQDYVKRNGVTKIVGSNPIKALVDLSLCLVSCILHVPTIRMSY